MDKILKIPKATDSFKEFVLLQNEFIIYDKLVKWCKKNSDVKFFSFTTKTTHYTIKIVEDGVELSVYTACRVFLRTMFADFATFALEKRYYPSPTQIK